MQHQLETKESKRGPSTTPQGSKQYQEFFAAVAANDRDKVAAHLKEGMPINANNNPKGETALHIALKHRHIAMFHLLMGHNPDVDVFNFDGTAIIHYAVLSGSLEAVKSLVEAGANIFRHCFLSFSATPLHLAIDENYFSITEYLLKKEVAQRKPSQNRLENSPGATPLIAVLFKRNYGLLDLFLTIDPTSLEDVDKFGETPIHNMVRQREFRKKNGLDSVKDTEEDKAALSKIIKICGTHLLKKTDGNGKTALHLAASLGDKPIVTQLVEEVLKEKKSAPAPVTAPCLSTPTIHNKFSEIKLLLQARTWSNESNNTNQIERLLVDSRPMRTPIELGDVTHAKLQENLQHSTVAANITFAKQMLQYALKHKQRHVVQCIVESKMVDLNQSINEEFFLQMAISSGCPFNVEYLLKKGAKLKCENSVSFIFMTLAYGEYDILELILKKDSSAVNENNIKGYTLFYAFILGDIQRKQLSIEKQIVIFKKLLPTTNKTKTLKLSLHAAVTKNELDLVKWLIAEGADVNLVTPEGLDLFHIAVRNGSSEIAEAIFNKMTEDNRHKLIKRSSESSIYDALRVAANNKWLRDNIITILYKINFSFKNKNGQLFHYACENRDHNFFKKYIHSAGVEPECFTARNRLEQTVPEAVINNVPAVFFQTVCFDIHPDDQVIGYQCMETIFLILDELPKELKKQILAMKSSVNNLTLLDLAIKINHPGLVEKLEHIASQQEQKSQPKSDSPTSKPTGDNYIAEAKEIIKQNPKRAIELLNQAVSDSHNKKAQRWLGHCYRLGIGGEQDAKQAFANYQAAAENGDIVAQCFVAASHRFGIGTVLDEKSSNECIRKIGSLGGIGSSFENDKIIFEDSVFYDVKLQEIIKLINKNEPRTELPTYAYDESFTRVRPKKIKNKKPSGTDHEAKETKEAPHFFKPDERYPELNEILECLQNGILKEPHFSISKVFSAQMKYASETQLIGMLHNFIVQNKWSIDEWHFSKIIQILGRSKLFVYVDEFFRIACNANIVHWGILSAFITAACKLKKYKYAKTVFENFFEKAIKEGYAHWINPAVLTSIMIGAKDAGEYEYAMSVFNRAIKAANAHWIDADLIKHTIKVLTAADKYEEAKSVFETCFDKAIKEGYPDWISSTLIAALIRIANSEDKYADVQDVFKKIKEGHAYLIDDVVLAVLIQAASQENDNKQVDILYQMAIEMKLVTCKVDRAYLTALIKNKEALPGKDQLIKQIYQQLPPFELIENPGEIDLHEQSYGSAWLGLKKYFVANAAKCIKLNIIVGKAFGRYSNKHNSYTVKQAVIDICEEFNCKWQHHRSNSGIIILRYEPRLSLTQSQITFPAEVKISSGARPTPTRKVSPDTQYTSFFHPLHMAEADAAPAPDLEIKVVKPIPPSKKELQLANNRLTELKLLAAPPTETQLKIIHAFLAKYFPLKDNMITINETLPDAIREQVNKVLRIIKERSTGVLLLVGSQVLFLILNAMQKALGLPEEKFNPHSDVDIRPLLGQTQFDELNKDFRKEFKVEFRNSIRNLHQTEIEGTKYDISESDHKSFQESAESADQTVKSFLAFSESKEGWTIYVSNPNHLVDAVRGIARPLTKPSQWIEKYAEGKADSSQYIIRFFNIFKSLIKGKSFPEEDLAELLSCIRSFGDAIRNPQVKHHAIAHIKKLLLGGNAEKFYEVTSALGAFNVIFPFMSDKVDKERVRQCMRNIDNFYKSGQRPNLTRVTAQLIALNTFEKDIVPRLKSMKQIINKHPLIKSIFDTVWSLEDESLKHAISEADNAQPEPPHKENKEENPKPINDRLLYRAHNKAITFLRELNNTSHKEDAQKLLVRVEEKIKKFQPAVSYTHSGAPFNQEVLLNQLQQITQLFNTSAKQLACDKYEEAISRFKDISKLLTQFTLNYGSLASSYKKSVDLIDNLTCLFLAFADNTDALQKILKICVEMKPDILLDLTPNVKVEPPSLSPLRIGSFYPPREAKRGVASEPAVAHSAYAIN